MAFRHHLLFLTLIAVFLNVRIAHACSCMGTCTVLASYESSSVVVIARAVSVEKGAGYEGISSTKMIVERVFKGDLKVGDEMTFGQGGNTDCIWGFVEPPIGKRYLLYLGSRAKDSGLWHIFSCSRSRWIQSADDQIDDLLYLNRLKEVSGKTRISGTIKFGNGADTSVEGRVIRIFGYNKSYGVKTNNYGVYEVYGIPAGDYLIEPEVPAGWKLDVFSLPFPFSMPRFGVSKKEQEKSLKGIPIVLEDKGHASLDMRFILE